MILRNATLYIRALEPTDLDFLFQIENDTRFWDSSNVHIPLSRYALHTYLQEQPADVFAASQLKWVICLNDGQSLGFVELNNIDHYHKRAEVGVLIAPLFQRKGYGTQALQLVIDYAQNHIGWHQLTALVAQKNTASHQLFQHVGFVQSGILKDYFKTIDGFEDATFYQLVL